MPAAITGTGFVGPNASLHAFSAGQPLKGTGVSQGNFCWFVGNLAFILPWLLPSLILVLFLPPSLSCLNSSFKMQSEYLYLLHQLRGSNPPPLKHPANVHYKETVASAAKVTTTTERL